MDVSQIIKALLTLNKRKIIDFAAFYGVTRQSMSNKMSRNSFSAEDLIKAAEFVDCELFFQLDDGQRIYLRMKKK